MTNEYTKMVLALDEEFFKEWKWKVGDNLIIISNKYNGEAIIIDADLKYNKESVECMSLNSEYIVFINLNSCIPIPSQEQLQEIIKNHILKDDETVLDYDIINFFCDWFKAHFCSKTTYKEIEHDLIKAVWLRYAMHIIYSKRWNGDSWEKMV